MKLSDLHEAIKKEKYDIELIRGLSVDELADHEESLQHTLSNLKDRQQYYQEELEKIESLLVGGGMTKHDPADEDEDGDEWFLLNPKETQNWKKRWAPDTPTNRQRAREFIETQRELNQTKKHIIDVKKEINAAVALQGAGGGNAANASDPVFHINNKVSLQNPFFKGELDRYSGDPEKFKWTSQMRTRYDEMKEILARHGIKLTQIHWGKWGVPTWGGRTYKANSFIAHDPRNKIVWYKYDSGPGAGQNFVYIDGKKMKTTSLLNATPQQQDAYFTSGKPV